MTAAIIGGGIAGLTAAYELVKAGERPILIEPGPLGGMIRSVSERGFTLEAGPNVLVERLEMTELLRELGLASSVCYPAIANYGQYVWHDGRPVKVPAGFTDLIVSPLFSLAAKLALPFKVIVPGFMPGSSDDISVADFFSPLLGRRAVRLLLDPVLKGIYGGDVEHLSARSLFSGLWEAARERRSILGYMLSRKERGKPPIMVLRGGIQSLTDSLWRSVSSHVELLPLRAERVALLDKHRFRVTLSDGRHLEVDGCIVTCAGTSAASLMYFVNEQVSEQLRSTQYAGLQLVHFAVPQTETLLAGAFGVLFPRGMPCNLLGVMFNSQLFPHVAPENKHLLTVVLGGAQAGGALIPAQQLQAELPELLRDLLRVKDVEWLHMLEWPRAIPQLAVGHYKLVDGLDRIEREHSGIVFAGVDRGGIGVSDRIRIAREAVKRFRRMRFETVV